MIDGACADICIRDHMSQKLRRKCNKCRSNRMLMTIVSRENIWNRLIFSALNFKILIDIIL